MIRVGLVGCGRHGERYLRHLQNDVDDAQVVAVWRRDPAQADRLADAYGVAVAGSAAELVERDDVDAVIIVTPPGNHFEELRACLAAGKPTLVEKPVTANLHEAQTLQAEVGSTPVMVAQTLRYHAALQAMREVRGDIGTIHRMRLQQRLEPCDFAWQRDPAVAGGGSVLLTGVHLFDQIRWILGRTPDQVRCRLLAVEGHPLENVFDACFEYDDERILVQAEVSKFSASRSGQVELIGTDAQLVVDTVAGRLTRIRGREIEELAAPGDVPTLPALLRDFVRVARGELPPPITLQDGLEAVAMAEACYLAHHRGGAVRFTDLRGEVHTGPACLRGRP